MENNIPVADLSLLRGYAETPEDMKEFIDVFIAEGARLITILTENCVEGECVTWTEAAHTLKGCSGMIGAHNLAALSKQAQDMKGVSSAERTAMLQTIQPEYMKVKEYLLSQI